MKTKPTKDQQIKKMRAQLRELKQENHHMFLTIMRGQELLRGVATGLLGPHPKDGLHDHSRLPELARQVYKLGVRSIGEFPKNKMVLLKGKK